VFFPGRPFQPSPMFVCEAGACKSKAPFGCFTVLALPTNIRLGGKSQPRTNTQAYYEHSQITDAKKFYNIALRSGFVEHPSPTYVTQQSVTKIISISIANLVTPNGSFTRAIYGSDFALS
jgi:hypothetical protein